jgi:hypothetical protein
VLIAGGLINIQAFSVLCFHCTSMRCIYMFTCNVHVFTVGAQPHYKRYAVAQLVEALRYKPEGRGFDYRWGHLDFSFISCVWPGVESSCNRDEHLGGTGGRRLGLTTLPPSCADCLEILEASTCWSSSNVTNRNCFQILDY